MTGAAFVVHSTDGLTLYPPSTLSHLALLLQANHEWPKGANDIEKNIEFLILDLDSNQGNLAFFFVCLFSGKETLRQMQQTLWVRQAEKRNEPLSTFRQTLGAEWLSEAQYSTNTALLQLS